MGIKRVSVIVTLEQIPSNTKHTHTGQAIWKFQEREHRSKGVE
jgi:hypothetical protein